MTAATATVGVEAKRLSFVSCLRILRLRLPACDHRDTRSFRQWYEALLGEMSQEVLLERRNRINPRVVKRKMSKFQKKRAKHRPVPPLKKKFVEAIVLET